MSDHRDNVIEKDYGHFGRESPTDETARRIVNDAVQAARGKHLDSIPPRAFHLKNLATHNIS